MMKVSPLKLHVSPASLPPRSPHVTLSRCTNPAPAKTLSLDHSPPKWEPFLGGAALNRLAPAKLGRRWPHYQGATNWDGLLNPLDGALRSEILRYGYFVEAAYRSFDFDPSSDSYGTCRFGKKDLLVESGFPDTGYRVTTNLRATSGIQIPRWTEKTASWAAMQSSWIGYVAVCTDKAEIQRLGRRDVVIALRGTATCLEWMENLRATLTELPGGGEGSDEAAMVESGFLSLYTSATATCPSLQETLRTEIGKILETYPGEELSFTITGHSLGAALATLAAHDIKTAFKDAAPLVTVISFGGPRVGNRSFRCHVEEQGIKILRIVNPNDLITKLPGFVIDDDEVEVSSGWGWWWGMGWFQKRVEETQWVYAEVGCELRLTAPENHEKKSPYMMNMNFAKCHDLKTYLNLVGNSCPLRATAKQLLGKDRTAAYNPILWNDINGRMIFPVHRKTQGI